MCVLPLREIRTLSFELFFIVECHNRTRGAEIGYLQQLMTDIVNS